MENLLPIADNSNPLNIRVGNPGLKPAFTHNMRLFYNTFNGELQRGMMTSQLRPRRTASATVRCTTSKPADGPLRPRISTATGALSVCSIQYGVEEQEVYGKLFSATQIQ